VLRVLRNWRRRLGAARITCNATFKKIMGVSPRQYAEGGVWNQFKKRIKEGADVTTAMYDAGYGSSSRLYEKSTAQLGMTTRAYGRGGASMAINYAIVTVHWASYWLPGPNAGCAPLHWVMMKPCWKRSFVLSFKSRAKSGPTATRCCGWGDC